MKKSFVIIVSIVSIILFILSGCDSTSFKYNKLYTEYVYVGTDSVFMPSGRTLVLNSDGSFTMHFDDELELTGIADLIEREQTIFLDCDENTAAVVKQRYKDSVLADPENAMPVEILDVILESLDISEEIHYYKSYMFSSSFISAHRYIDTTLYSFGEDYSVFEGVYKVQDYDGLMLLKQGVIYVQDEEEPVSGSFPTVKGSYIYANDFITMTINDSEGNPQAAQKYLVADLILPFEISTDETESETDTILDDEEWNEAIKDQLVNLQGQKIKVLVLCFYTKDKI